MTLKSDFLRVLHYLSKEAFMTRYKITSMVPPVLFALALSYSPLWAGSHEGSQHDTKAGATAEAGRASTIVAMPGPGKKVPIGNDGYIIYGFDKKPKIGMLIMKVEVYTRDGKRDTSLEILGDAGMPSMSGAHETGDQPFRLSRKGDYLLPVNIVMPGDWEIRLTIRKDGRVIFRGSHGFDV